MDSDNLKFISNNVRGTQNSEKRIKIFEYLKNSLTPNGFIFLQETHSCVDDKKKRCDQLIGNSYFSRGKINSCSVAIGYVRSKSFALANQTADKNGRLLLIEAIVDDVKLALINIYICNTESQSFFTLTELHKILQNVDDIENKNIIIGGGFNFHFNSKLETQRGKPTLQKKSIRKMIELIQSFELCDISRIRNSTEKRLTSRQNHISGYIHGRLVCLIVFLSLMSYKNQ